MLLFYFLDIALDYTGLDSSALAGNLSSHGVMIKILVGAKLKTQLITQK